MGECPVRVRFHDVSHQMTERTDLITSDRYDQLSRFGVSSVDGLAIDTVSGSLLVVDNSRDELVVIDLQQLAD